MFDGGYDGGDLNHTIFEKILSIGYEFETSSLSKLTLLGDNILLNTDTVSNDLQYINKDASPDNDDTFSLLRKHELIEFDIYNNNKTKDENSKFYVLNDITNSKFVKKLTALCEEPTYEAITLQSREYEEQGEEYDEESIYKEFKNELYTFETPQKIYKINFETRMEKDCGTFADVEWVFTFYKPKLNKKIILNTFTTAVKNLINHLQKLKAIRGNLVINYNQNNSEIIANPKERILFHYPNTNMYYLQTYYLDEAQNTSDICIVPQMTFSCNISNSIPIVKELIRDSLQIYKDELSKTYLNIIIKLENCVNELLENYNQNAKKPIKDYKAKVIKSYIFLILFKLYRYYNSYLIDQKNNKDKEHSGDIKYLKDKLFINSRHSNSELYKQLKIAIATYYDITDTKAIEIIKQIVIQKSVLEKYMDEGHKVIRKGAFDINNVLEKKKPPIWKSSVFIFILFSIF